MTKFFHLSVLVFAAIFLTMNGLGAQVTLRGRVFDALNKGPLAGAELASGEYTGVSDAEGRFTLRVAAVPATLQVRAKGYEGGDRVVENAEAYVGIALTPAAKDLREEIVITDFGPRGRYLDQPGSVSVVTPRELARDNGLVLTPALNRVPGVYMHSGTLSTHRITIRGIGSRSPFGTNKIRAYYGEIPLTSGDGETALEDIDLSIVGRAEVIKGPSSSLYGAGLGGTILLQPSRHVEPGTWMSGNAMAGSFGLLRSAGRYTTSNTQNYTESSYNYTRSDGARENNNYERYGFTGLREIYGEKTSLSLLTNFIHAKAFIPSSIDSNTFVNNPRAAAPTWLKTKGYEQYNRFFFGASLRYSFWGRWQGVSSTYAGFRNNYEPRPFNILREASYWVGSRTRIDWRGNLAGRPFAWAGGYELYQEWYDWQTYENIAGLGERGVVLGDNAEVRDYINFFTHAEWKPFARTLLVLGLNANRTDYVYSDYYAADTTDRSGNYRFSDQWSPRIAISQGLAADISAFASVSQGFSPPTLSETLTPDGVINPNIRPETGWNYEAGLRGVLKKRFFFETTLYHMDVRNLLVAERTADDQFVGRNAGRTRHDGAEFFAEYRAGSDKSLNITLFTSYHYARYRFLEFTDRDKNYAGNALTGVPAHTLSSGVDLNSRIGFFGNIQAMYVSEIPMLDDNSKYAHAYFLLHTQAGYGRMIGERFRFKLLAGINNVTDAQYASMIQVNAAGTAARPPRFYYPGMPRNVYVNLELGLRL